MVVDVTPTWLSHLASQDKDIVQSTAASVPTTPFMLQAKELNYNLAQLEEFLRKHYEDYVDFNRAVTTRASNMTDMQRDAVDEEATAFLTGVVKGIDGMKDGLARTKQTTQASEGEGGSLGVYAHRSAGVAALFERLKEVSQLAERMQTQRYMAEAQASQRFFVASMAQVESIKMPPIAIVASQAEVEEDEKVAQVFGGALGANDRETQLMLADENAELLSELRSEVDDVKQMENKMAEISGLMNVFASKVIEQQSEVEHIFEAAVDANEQVKRGGEHLSKALERSGTFRKIYVGFMMVMTSSLLFLHWFKD
ncbi:unnamed protein product [Chrysoparadoxa australica]